VERRASEQLLEALKTSNQELRERAAAELWRSWFEQKGDLGLELLRRSQFFLEAGQFQKAEEILTETIEMLPDFAEAWNRRAVLYYLQEKYERSKSDCEQVVKLISYHFGAWHGLGLCQFALANYSEAIVAFRKAQEIQPYALINQQLILECTARLS
jgi:tetratricopeptide (TPR) repeat protein